MLKDGRTHGRKDDGQKVITIAHPEHSSGELKDKIKKLRSRTWNVMTSCPPIIPVPCL